MNFKIDKGVPIPVATNQGKYPLQDMEVGDSFFVAGITSGAVAGSANHAAKRTGFKFTTRNVTENGVKGVRVWRVE